ncbi:DUF1178 family protein [Pelagibacterium montanilacus]|uniref:DUF1178 family protein n=1 Tax=Pelagibacterium montanilacus TaxID=2185280 RepID=UPI000F8CBA91|nr:DUF1178 family protein [Pelagibacterium montanilacus]
MISYALACEKGHGFDAWFRNALAFDEQKAKGVLTCPVCGSGAVDKTLMAPAVARKDETVSLSAGHPDRARHIEMLRKLREAVTSKADYVGDRFAEEARRIHFEEAEARGIYGEASRDEVASLLEDGIEFVPLPSLPDEHN